jgi:hypothetical protein
MSLRKPEFFTQTAPSGRVVSLEKQFGMAYTPDPTTPILLRNTK